jgi:hypothetical protein
MSGIRDILLSGVAIGAGMLGIVGGCVDARKARIDDGFAKMLTELQARTDAREAEAKRSPGNPGNFDPGKISLKKRVEEFTVDKRNIPRFAKKLYNYVESRVGQARMDNEGLLWGFGYAMQNNLYLRGVHGRPEFETYHEVSETLSPSINAPAYETCLEISKAFQTLGSERKWEGLRSAVYCDIATGVGGVRIVGEWNNGEDMRGEGIARIQLVRGEGLEGEGANFFKVLVPIELNVPLLRLSPIAPQIGVPPLKEIGGKK